MSSEYNSFHVGRGHDAEIEEIEGYVSVPHPQYSLEDHDTVPTILEQTMSCLDCDPPKGLLVEVAPGSESAVVPAGSYFRSLRHKTRRLVRSLRHSTNEDRGGATDGGGCDQTAGSMNLGSEIAGKENKNAPDSSGGAHGNNRCRYRRNASFLEVYGVSPAMHGAFPNANDTRTHSLQTVRSKDALDSAGDMTKSAQRKGERVDVTKKMEEFTTSILCDLQIMRANIDDAKRKIDDMYTNNLADFMLFGTVEFNAAIDSATKEFEDSLSLYFTKLRELFDAHVGI